MYWGVMERCMSTKFTAPAFMAFRMSAFDWYGARYSRASARARTPSKDGPPDAPVMALILKALPAACSAFALSAIAVGIAFAAPAGVKPLKAMLSPFLMRPAASSAVIIL